MAQARDSSKLGGYRVKITTPSGRVIYIWTPVIEDLLKGGNHNMQEFNKIKSIRVGAGITQQQMANALGVSRPTYMAKEEGTSDWKLSEMQNFVNYINEVTGKSYNAKDIFF